MATHLVLIEEPRDWKKNYPDVMRMTAQEYLNSDASSKKKNLRIINLCRDYSYLSTGYYCSLLAEARKHKILPSVRTLTDLSSKKIYSLNAADLDQDLQKPLAKINPDPVVKTVEIDIFFGQTASEALQDIARQLYELFRTPLMRVTFERDRLWEIAAIRRLHMHRLTPTQEEFFIAALNQYMSKPWRSPKTKTTTRYDMAILFNPAEQLPPSDRAALNKFIKAGKRLDIDVELIEKKDFNRLAEYDALFIRETTNIDHHTYRFAKKAENEGMIVIDDPDSIVKCSNKIFLTDLMRTNRIPMPQTEILYKSTWTSFVDKMVFPAVLKIPDGSFSRGVFKAADATEFRQLAEPMFKQSDLILTQEYLYTEYDWRIGILNGQAIFACQYFMSREHWQIVKHDTHGRAHEGTFKAFPIEQVPEEVIKVALRLAQLIGDGLYGVDIKHNERGVFVIEINDNPNIDGGVEDSMLGDRLYEIIMAEFIRRLDVRRGYGNSRITGLVNG
jgi:glutathione synthase/RimK-type ligase-like ATP-grasp enzyme